MGLPFRVTVGRDLEDAPAQEILLWALEHFGDSVAISTSFQAEGMVILDMVSRITHSARVFTLDTGRLPEETYQMIETVRERYGLQVEIVAPNRAELEAMVARHGPNLFYKSVPLRMLCCHVRKTRPLERKLRQLKGWVVGLRREQTGSRSEVAKVEWNESRLKISPLADWTKQQVEEYVREHQVPMHPLYSAGYRSIGCGPCTRAVEPWEHERAGRWWWEEGVEKECGIHVSPRGEVQRHIDVLLSDLVRRSRPAQVIPMNPGVH